MQSTVLRALGFLALAAACSESGRSRPTATEDDAAISSLDKLKAYLAAPAATAPPVVLVGSGDIAKCLPGPTPNTFVKPGPDHPAEKTAAIIDLMPGATVVTLGDNAYELGSPYEYVGCYHPSWGRHHYRTRPALGNHEYLTPTANGFFLYFSRSVQRPGYYSYTLGNWHVVVLNSTPQVYNCWRPATAGPLPDFPSAPPPHPDPGVEAGRECAGDSEQLAWLEADLAANPSECTIAYFHHPRFSSGPHGNHYQMQKVWDMLYAAGVDVVLGGHDHVYERFAPQDPAGNADPVFGIRQFTAGIGGDELYPIETVKPNSEAHFSETFGVLAFVLDAGTYAWMFIGVDYRIHDSGEGTCHGAPGP